MRYTKEHLDLNYEQRVWAKNAEEVVARYASRSAEARRTLHLDRDIAYGPGPDERRPALAGNVDDDPVRVFVYYRPCFSFRLDQRPAVLCWDCDEGS